jgi:hypothetical protein
VDGSVTDRRAANDIAAMLTEVLEEPVRYEAETLEEAYRAIAGIPRDYLRRAFTRA